MPHPHRISTGCLVSQSVGMAPDHAATGRLLHGRYDSVSTKAAPELSSYHPCRCCALGRFSAPSLPEYRVATKRPPPAARRPATGLRSDGGESSAALPLTHGRALARFPIAAPTARRHSASCTKTAAAEPAPGKTGPRIAPHRALDQENAGQTSNEAAMRAARDAIPRHGCFPHGQHRRPPPSAPGRRLRLDRPLQLRVPPRRARHGRKVPSGHGQPPRRRRRRVTLQGRSASGGPAKRVDTVTAVASRHTSSNLGPFPAARLQSHACARCANRTLGTQLTAHLFGP